ncbi:MAG TPA: PAS domain S-box protein [Anaerolineales bacterium]|nr:PAS domain S-box protein [Anaerolineales bacterium]
MNKNSPAKKDRNNEQDERLEKRLHEMYDGQDLPAHASTAGTDSTRKKARGLENLGNQYPAKGLDRSALAKSGDPGKESMRSKLESPLSPDTKTRATKVKWSIQAKILLGAGLSLVLSILILVTFTATTLRKQAIENAEHEAASIGEAEAGHIQNRIDKILFVAKTLASSIGVVKDPGTPVLLTREQVNGMLRRTLEENPDFLGTWTLWESNAFDGLDAEFAGTDLHDATGRFIPYWVRDGKGNIHGEAIVDYETPGVGDFYVLPRETLRSTVISPFFYSIQGTDVLMTSLVVPIVENGTFYGVAGVDLKIEFVQEIVNNINLYEGTASSALFTDKGVLVAVQGRPGQTLQSANGIYENFPQIQSRLKPDQTITFQSQDGKFLYVFSPVTFSESDTTWYLGMAIPFEKITASATAAAIRQTWIGTGILFGAIILLLAITQQIVKPIKKLTETANTAAEGNLHIKADVTTTDETGVLARSFNAMLSQLQGSFETLELRVAERTHDLQLAAEVGQAITKNIADVREMLGRATETIRERFNLYHTQVYLLDAPGKILVLQASTGEVGKRLLETNHRLPVGMDSLNGRAALEKRAILVEDTTHYRDFKPNPLLPNTKSELAVPLMLGEQVIGVLDMQSDWPKAFNEFNLSAFQTMAGQIAIAVQNAELFNEAQEARKQAEENIQRITEREWGDYLDAIERSENIGYIYNQEGTIQYEDKVTPALPKESLYLPLTIAGAKVGSVQSSIDKKTINKQEMEILEQASQQLSRHLENLRLLEEAEQYRRQAEQAARRLTREGWEQYLKIRQSLQPGFAYDQNRVKPASSAEAENGPAVLRQTVKVRNESIGEVKTAVANNMSPEEAEKLIEQVSNSLSAHIENLRLLEEAEVSRMEVQKSQEQYELAVEGSNDGLWDWNIDTNEIYFSPRWKAMIGYSEEELTHGFSDFESLLHPDDRTPVLGYINDYLSGHLEEYDIEFRFQHKNGSYRWIRARGKALRRENGSPYRMAGSHTDITESKMIEEFIRHNEARLRVLVENTADAFVSVDVSTGLFIEPNENALRLYGLSRDELLNVGPVDMSPEYQPDGRLSAEKAMEYITKAMHSDEPINFEWMHINAQGQEIPCELRLLRLPGDHPQVRASITDITERKAAEDETRRLAQAVQSTADMVVITDREGTIKFVNSAFEKVTGYKVEEALGGNPRLLKSGLQGEAFYKNLWGQILSGKPWSGEITNRRKDGALYDAQLTISPIVDHKGEITQFVAVQRDITQNKRDQMIISQRANQLETVATVSTTASTVLNPDTLLQTVVDLTKERFGLYHVHIYLADDSWSTLILAAGAGEVGRIMVTSGHAIQMNAERSLVARAYRDHLAVIVNNIHEDEGFLPNPLLPETHAEMAVPMIVGDKALGIFDVQSSEANYFTQEDALIFNTLATQVAVALQNARLYQEQTATVAQLRELDRLKSSFLANMSHELRTPLNSILGFTDVMLEGLDGSLTPYMQNDLGLIQKNGLHLLHLINDVLDMAKIESGKLNLVIEKFNLHDIFEEAISITSSIANEKSLKVKIEADSDAEVEVSADRTRLRQVFINLINNAVKFTDKGSVSIRAVREANNVLVSIKDTGIGIPPSHLESIFQEFTQVDSSTTRKVGGTGLGLPISRKLIQMQGGRLWAESSGIEGTGSIFYIFMPIEAKVAEPEIISKRTS